MDVAISNNKKRTQTEYCKFDIIGLDVKMTQFQITKKMISAEYTF